MEAEPHPHAGARVGIGDPPWEWRGLFAPPPRKGGYPEGAQRELLWGGLTPSKCRHPQSGTGNGVPVWEEAEPHPHTWAGSGELTRGEQRGEPLMRASDRSTDGNPMWGGK